MEVIELRRSWLIPSAVLLGVAVGLLLSFTIPTARRAEASVLISSPAGTSAVTPFLSNLRELATSGVLAGNVRSTLRLDESVAEVRDQLDAEVRPGSQVIAISAEDDDPETARQLAQEAAGVFTQLVASRFGTRSPPLQAALIDSAHVLDERDRHFLRNALIGGAVGLIAGLIGALLLQSRRPLTATGVEGDLRKRESELDKRVKTVTARERELAKRAGQLAARERRLAVPAPAPAPKPEPEPEPEPPPAFAPEPVAATTVTRAGSWNINDLERAVDARSAIKPEQAEEWRTYLFFLRQHAGSDGSLPPQFDGLVLDVFGEIVR